MADSRFFIRSPEKTIADIAALCGAELVSGDPSLPVCDVAPLDQAGAGHLSFLDNIRYRAQFGESRAAACIIAPEMKPHAPDGMALLISPSPYRSYALAAQSFYPDTMPPAEISDKAHIHPDAVIGEGCRIEPGAVIGQGARIGGDSWIGANTVIASCVEIGQGCRIGSNVTVTHALIGDHVRIYAGCRIGQDGFGFAMDPSGFVRVPQLGRVIIEDSVEIGANTTIDRGAGPDTVIGRGTWIDNLVQIGHNVKIGQYCVLVSQSGVSGSTILEDYVVLAGQAGLAGHLKIGKGAQIGAKAGVMRDVPAGAKYLGSPAMPIKDFMKQTALLKRLLKKDKK